jgi:Ulp1 family protease
MAYLNHLVEDRPEWAVIDSLLLANAKSRWWERVAERLRTRKVTRLLLPIHDVNHWRLVVVDRPAATIRCYDSLPDAKGIKKSLAFVRDEVLPQKLGWAETAWAADGVEAPGQEDGHSCGPYILWWAKQLVENPSATLSKPAATWRNTVKSILQSFSQKMGNNNVAGEGGAGARGKKRKRGET